MANQVVTATCVSNPAIGANVSSVGWAVFREFLFFLKLTLLALPNSGNCRCVGFCFRLSFAFRFRFGLGSSGGRSSVAAAVDKGTLVSPFASSRGKNMQAVFLEPGGPRLLERDRAVFFDVPFPFALALGFGARLCSYWHSLPRGQAPVFQ